VILRAFKNFYGYFKVLNTLHFSTTLLFLILFFLHHCAGCSQDLYYTKDKSLEAEKMRSNHFCSQMERECWGEACGKHQGEG
jgi:hypothetical protein